MKRALYGILVISCLIFQESFAQDRTVTKIKIIGAANKHASDAVKIGFTLSPEQGSVSQNKSFFLAPANKNSGFSGTIQLNIDIVAPGSITAAKVKEVSVLKPLPLRLAPEYFDKSGVVHGMIIYNDKDDFYFQPIILK